MVLELAPSLGVKAAELELKLAALFDAEEAFLTTSVREIVPITSVNDKPVGSGKPGPVTKRLMAAYKELVKTTTT